MGPRQVALIGDRLGNRLFIQQPVSNQLRLCCLVSEKNRVAASTNLQMMGVAVAPRTPAKLAPL